MGVLKKDLLIVLLLSTLAIAETNETTGDVVGQVQYIGLTQTLANINATLKYIAPYLSVTLLILGGIAYGLSYTQPAEVRGKWQTTAIGLIIGGIIITAFTMAAGAIQQQSATLLT